jgi:hypothetical protein
MPRSKIIGPQANFGRRNLIINGAMQVSQRGVTGTTPTTNNYVLDRFALSRFGGYPDNATQTQESDAPTGHSKSFKMVRNSAHTLTGTNASAFKQRIEGQNMAHLNWGLSTAKSCIISFWVKSNQTGDFPLILADSGNALDIGKLYTISSANTWEHKKIKIEAPTAGTFNTDNTTGATVYWGFGAVDAARTAQGTTWGSSNTSGSSKGMVTGASTALATTSGATWQITGVQMEIGDTATDFEHRPYGEELSLCQRYLYRINGSLYEFFVNGVRNNTNYLWCPLQLPVALRAQPAITTSGTSNDCFGIWHGAAGSWSTQHTTMGVYANPDLQDGSVIQLALALNGITTSFSSGQCVTLGFQNNGFLNCDAEL